MDQRLSALACLGAINSLTHATKILKSIALDFELVRPSDIHYPLGGLRSHSPFASQVRPMIWEWVLENWTVIHKQFHPTMALLGHVITSGFASSVGNDVADTVEAWYTGAGLNDEEKAKRKEEVKGAKARIEQSLEAVRANTAFLEREKEALAAWMKKEFPEL